MREFRFSDWLHCFIPLVAFRAKTGSMGTLVRSFGMTTVVVLSECLRTIRSGIRSGERKTKRPRGRSLMWNLLLLLFYRVAKIRKQADGNFIACGLNELRDGGVDTFEGGAVMRNVRHDTC